jgi:predicted permease
MFASPSAVSSYTMAQQMDGDGDLAGQIVVFTTAISLITLFFWISGLMLLGFI